MQCGQCRPDDSAQDALEYFQHLLELMTRAERAAGSRLGGGDISAAGPSAEVFSFQLEDRKQVGVAEMSAR